MKTNAATLSSVCFRFRFRFVFFLNFQGGGGVPPEHFIKRTGASPVGAECLHHFGRDNRQRDLGLTEHKVSCKGDQPRVGVSLSITLQPSTPQSSVLAAALEEKRKRWPQATEHHTVPMLPQVPATQQQEGVNRWPERRPAGAAT